MTVFSALGIYARFGFQKIRAALPVKLRHIRNCGKPRFVICTHVYHTYRAVKHLYKYQTVNFVARAAVHFYINRRDFLSSHENGSNFAFRYAFLRTIIFAYVFKKIIVDIYF